MKLNTLHIMASWRRRLSNLGLLAGLSLIAAPPAMHAYGTWWEHRQTALFLAQADEAPAPGTPTAPDAPASPDTTLVPTAPAAPEVRAAPDVHAVPDKPAPAETHGKTAPEPAPEASPPSPPVVKKAAGTAPVQKTSEIKKAPASPARSRTARQQAARQPAAKHPSNRVGEARVSHAWRDSLLQIPSIGVEAVVTRPGGNWRWVKGPAYDPKSAAPGSPGNAVIAAHRNMWARTFEHLPRVKPGDRIAIQSQGQRHVYVVQWSRKVRTSDTGVLANTKDPCVTLYTCILPYRANERWAVRGRLLKTLSAEPPATTSDRIAQSR